jgi:hypothetical protein
MSEKRGVEMKQAEREKRNFPANQQKACPRVLEFPERSAKVIRLRRREWLEEIARNMELYGQPQPPKAS